jgi:predicted component of type VI protein secretion system
VAGFWLKYEGTRFPIRRGETLIGRSAYCSIVISDPSVSREHAALRMSGEGLLVADLGSRNGTFVNGERVGDSRKLGPGDTIVLGRALMQVIAAEEVPRAKMHTTGTLEVHAPEPFEDPTTQTQPVTLALIETLVGRANDDGGGTSEIASAIKNAIDAMMLQSKRTQQPLTGTDAERLAATAQTVATWVADGSLDPWRDTVLRMLSEGA